MDNKIVANRFPGGTVFKNSGSSHVTTQEGGRTHITVDIAGLKQGGNVGVHFPVSNTGAIGPAKPFYYNTGKPIV